MPVGGKANGGQGRWEAGGRRGWVLLSGHLSPWRCCPGGRTGPQAAGGSSAEEAEARAGAEPKQTSGPRWPPPSPTCHLAPGWGPRGQRLWHRPLLNRHPDPPALSPAGCVRAADPPPSPRHPACWGARLPHTQSHSTGAGARSPLGGAGGGTGLRRGPFVFFPSCSSGLGPLRGPGHLLLTLRGQRQEDATGGWQCG